MYKYIPFNRPESWQEFLTHQEKQRRNPTWQEFAIIDKTRRSGPKLAGMISMINSSAEQLCSELGAVFVFPEFQVGDTGSGLFGFSCYLTSGRVDLLAANTCEHTRSRTAVEVRT